MTPPLWHFSDLVARPFPLARWPVAQLLEVQHHVDWCLEGWSVIVEAQLVDLEEIIWKSFAKSKDLKMFITYQNWVGQKRLYLCPQEEATYEYVLYSCCLDMLEPVRQFRHLHLQALTSESFSLWTPKRSSPTYISLINSTSGNYWSTRYFAWIVLVQW